MQKQTQQPAEQPYSPPRYHRRLRIAGLAAIALVPIAVVAGFLIYGALEIGAASHQRMLASLQYPALPSPGSQSRLIVKDHLGGTIVWTPWIKLESSLDDATEGALYLRLQDWYPGVVRSEVREEISIAMATSGTVHLPRDWRAVSLTISTTEELVRHATEYEMGLAQTFSEDWQTSAVQFSLPTEDFVAAVNHGMIDGKIGGIEFSLNSDAIQIIDEFAAYLRPGTSPRP